MFSIFSFRHWEVPYRMLRSPLHRCFRPTGLERLEALEVAHYGTRPGVRFVWLFFEHPRIPVSSLSNGLTTTSERPDL